MSRLYPGWGSGRKPFEGTFTVNSMAIAGKDEMEAGDKVILPQSTFKEISKLRLPFPLLFQVKNPRLEKQRRAASHATRSSSSSLSVEKKRAQGRRGPGDQKRTAIPGAKKDAPKEGQQSNAHYCGLMEFSAPEGVAYMPYWMMASLKLKEGSKCHFKTIFQDELPKGLSCKLQPHKNEFLDVAAAMDIRLLLEQAFRNYSVLTKGETIVVSLVGNNYKVNVVETNPATSISLYGSLDLEVDFAPPLDSCSMGKIRPRRKNTSQASLANDGESKSGLTQGSPNQTFSNENLLDGATTAGALAAPDKDEDDQEHNWGQGQSLSGAKVEQPVAHKERKPSRFAKRNQAAKFGGTGRSLSIDSAPSQGASGTASPATCAQGDGSLEDQVQGLRLGGEDEQSVPTVSKQDMRQKRLQFFEQQMRKQQAVEG